MVNLIFSNKPFGLRYDLSEKKWKIIFEQNINRLSTFKIGKAGDTTNQKLDASWLLLFETDGELYTVRSRRLRYIFESDKKIRFYFNKTNKIFDTRSNVIIKDKIKILGVNNKPNQTNSFTYDLEWEITDEFIGADGYTDSKKIEISFNDFNDDGVVDDPDLFDTIVSPPASTWDSSVTYTKNSYVFYANQLFISLVDNNLNFEPKAGQSSKWKVNYGNFVILEKYETLTTQYDYRHSSFLDILIVGSESDVKSSHISDQYYYFTDNETLAKFSMQEGRLIYNLDYKVYLGRNNLKFQYVHSADYNTRIDPGQINLMDLYVLTKNYDLEYRRYIAGAIENEPLPPSSDQLYITMNPFLNQIKAMSDEIIYHSVKYKVLFGSMATPNLRAVFKLIKNSEQIISDNEIKSRVLAAINEFFSIENWDFGDTFYFSELVTYIMNRTAPYLVNIVIVPRQVNLYFGSLFEIKSENDEIFINGATSDDIMVIDALTANELNAEGDIVTRSNILNKQSVSSGTGSY
jgi:hypothetical protein